MISLVVASSVLSFSESWADLQRSQLNSLTQGLFQVNSALLSGFFDISREITRVAENTRGTWYHDKEQNGKCRNGRYSWCYGGQCLDVTYGLACLAGLKRGRRNLGARGRKERNLARSRAHKFPLSLPLLTPATQAKIFAVRRNQYGIFALVSQTSLVKPVMASRSVDCSLRLIKHLMTELSKSSALVLLTVLIQN